jgi:hypothetical protein
LYLRKFSDASSAIESPASGLRIYLTIGSLRNLFIKETVAAIYFIFMLPVYRPFVPSVNPFFSGIIAIAPKNFE